MMNHTEVRSRDDLVRYLNGLVQEIGAHQRKVENVGTEDFIEALAAWITDMDGYFANRGEVPPGEVTWQLMAMAIAAGLVYE